MTISELQFTPSEAAFIADLPVKEVQKAFDEDWFDFVPRHTRGGTIRRWLGPAELLHLRIVKDAGRYVIFQTEAKKLIHRQLRERMAVIRFADRDDVVIDHLHSWFVQMAKHLKEPVKISEISVDAESAWEQMAGRLAEATAAQLAVVSDPDIRGGEPVVRGTRIPVHLLQELVEQGAAPEELLADYPSLDDQRLKLALLYAQNHPRPGRPRKRPWHTKARV